MTIRAVAVPATRFAERLSAARDATYDRGAAALLIGVGPQLRWLTGYAARPLERLTMLVLPVDGRAALIAPRLERAPALGSAAGAAGLVDVVSWDETDDPIDRVATSLPAGADVGRLLLSDHLWAIHALALQARFSAASFGLASEAIAELRAVKDADEIDRLRAAGAAADRVVEAVAAGRLIARSEAEVAREVHERLLDEGHDEAAFAIVASGSNSASPHHDPGDRRIEAGDAIVLDIGGVLGGYCSDTTRTLWVTGGDGRPDPDFLTRYAILQRAQAEATAAVRPGVTCEAIDASARTVIIDAGYGDQFIHRTGHGIGLEVHEDPYIVAGNTQPLRVGHAFSIEPGIYVEGRDGARIEDIVVCAPDGADAMNRSSRDLYVVSGT
ncbi:MAG TPA: Xaa-Pro peptidase family protein [Candidatus Limnocylindrales bacterium]